MSRRPAIDPRQLGMELFQIPTAPARTPGSLACGPEICGLLSAAIKGTDMSRAQIAAGMSDLTGDVITEPMLNAWTAKSHDRHRFPLEYAAAFETVTETTSLQQLLARQRGSVVLVGKEALDAELGRLRRQQADLKQRERQLEQLMKVTR